MLKLDLQFFASEPVCIYVKDNSGNELFSTEARTASFEITVTETGLTCSTTGESVSFSIDNFAGFSLTKGATEAEYTIGNTYTIYGMPGPEEGTNVLYIVEGGDVMPTIKGVWRFTTSTLDGITDETWGTTELAVNVSIQGYAHNDVTHLKFNKSFASSSSIDSIYPGNSTSQYEAIYNDYHDEPWMAESYKTWDFGETAQTVPDWFYTLVTSKAVQLYKIKGKWVFNDTISFPETLHQTVKFTSNSVGWNDMAKSLSSDDLGYFYDYDDEMALYNWVYKNGTWNDNSYQTVDFGSTEQTVSDAFYTWCTANATQQVETPPYKFTKLVKAEETESGIDTSTGYRFAFSDDIEQTDVDRLVYVSVYKKPTSSSTYSFRADAYYCGFVFPSATPWYIEELFMGRPTAPTSYKTLTVYMWGYGAYKINDGDIVTLSASSYSSAKSVTLNFGDTITLYAQIVDGGIA